LFGDADVVATVREAPRERTESGRVAHGRGDRDDVVPLFGDRDDLVTEDLRPALAAGRSREAGSRIEAAGLVHLVGLVVLRRRVPPRSPGAARHGRHTPWRDRRRRTARSTRASSRPSRADSRRGSGNRTTRRPGAASAFAPRAR